VHHTHASPRCSKTNLWQPSLFAMQTTLVYKCQHYQAASSPQQLHARRPVVAVCVPQSALTHTPLATPRQKHQRSMHQATNQRRGMLDGHAAHLLWHYTDVATWQQGAVEMHASMLLTMLPSLRTRVANGAWISEKGSGGDPCSTPCSGQLPSPIHL
jgi:hypothetical protein